MNGMDELLRLVTDLRPARLDQLADDSYARSRAADLARTAMESPRRPAPARRRRPPAGSGRPGWYLPPSAIAAIAMAAAVVAIVFSGALPGSGPRQVASTAADARRFLQASGAVAAQAPATTGAYWYIRIRDFTPSLTVRKRSYGAIVAATSESWYGQVHGRETSNEDVSFSFASAADETRWQAAGKPLLATEGSSFGSTRPETSYFAKVFWPVPGEFQALSLHEMRQLPATATGLRAMIRRLWNGPAETYLKRGATRASARPTYDSFLVGWADIILTGPTMPETKAAIYQLLAGQPGLKIIRSVTDPLGRTGIAVTDGRFYLLIDPQTARPLAITEHPVQANSVISAAQGDVAVFEAMGWTSRIGVPPSP